MLTFVVKRLKLVAVEVRSPPLTAKSLSTITLLLLIVVVVPAEALPIFILSEGYAVYKFTSEVEDFKVLTVISPVTVWLPLSKILPLNW